MIPADKVRQSQEDRAEIKIKLIKNGMLIKDKSGWEAFKKWEDASEYIGQIIASTRKGA